MDCEHQRRHGQLIIHANHAVGRRAFGERLLEFLNIVEADSRVKHMDCDWIAAPPSLRLRFVWLLQQGMGLKGMMVGMKYPRWCCG